MSILLLLLGLAVLIMGAEALVRGASALALQLGVSRLVVGLTVVSFGTSSPELAVSVTSAAAGQGGVAMGNIIGSNIFNIAVILGISALICPLAIHGQLLRWDLPVMFVSAGLLTFLLLTGGGLARGEAALLLMAAIGYTVWTVVLGKRDVSTVRGAMPLPVAPAGRPRAFHLLLIGAGLAMLAGGATLFVDGAVLLARRLGLSEAVVGLTIVAAGTSMPELAASVSAALHRQADLAVGTIVGSNIFNALCIGGSAGLCHPITAAGIDASALGCMLVGSALLLPMMRTGFTLVRWEGAACLAGYAGYLYLIWPR
jgi:cation:H+ antiporter